MAARVIIMSARTVMMIIFIMQGDPTSAEYHSVPHRCDNFECVMSRLNAITYKVQYLMSLRKTVQKVERRVDRQQWEMQEMKRRMGEIVEELKEMREEDKDQSIPFSDHLISGKLRIEDEESDGLLHLEDLRFIKEHQLELEGILNSSLDRMTFVENEVRNALEHVDVLQKRVDFLGKENSRLYRTMNDFSDAANVSESRIRVLESRENILSGDAAETLSGIQKIQSGLSHDLGDLSRTLGNVTRDLKQLADQAEMKSEVFETRLAWIENSLAGLAPVEIVEQNMTHVHRRIDSLGEEVRQFWQREKHWEQQTLSFEENLQARLEQMRMHVRWNITELREDVDEVLGESGKVKRCNEEIETLRQKLDGVSKGLEKLREDFENSQLIRKKEQQLRGNLLQQINSKGKTLNFEELAFDLMNENAADDERNSSRISIIHSSQP